jgi:hypothetical protein
LNTDDSEGPLRPPNTQWSMQSTAIPRDASSCAYGVGCRYLLPFSSSSFPSL